MPSRLPKPPWTPSRMKLLIDESLNVRMRHLFTEHDARTVDYMGWKGVGNGELLALARREFDAFITRDANMPEQQNITAEEIPIVVVRARSNRISDLAPLVPQIREALRTIQRGQVVRIYPPQP